MSTSWFHLLFTPQTQTAHVALRDDIGCGGETSGDLARELDAVRPAQVDLLVASSGGCSICGLNLYAIFSHFNTIATITRCCSSAAAFAVMGARKTSILPSARILIHSPSGYALGTPEELRETAREVDKLKELVQGILLQRTGQSSGIVSEWLAKDTWFSAQEALAAGLVDEIIEAPPAPAIAAGKPVSASASVRPMTESEALFCTWLSAFGSVEVANKQQFAHYLHDWLQCCVSQTEPMAEAVNIP